MTFSKKWLLSFLPFLLFAEWRLEAASAVDTFGLSPQEMAIGNAASAVGDGGETSATYAASGNPARLVVASRPLFGVNASSSHLRLRDLGGEPSTGASGLPASHYRASQSDDLRATSFGLNLPLLQGVNFGMTGYLPSDKFAAIQAVSGDDIGYLRYDDRQRKPELHTAVGLDLGHGLSLGVGAYYTVSASGEIEIALSDKDSQGRMGLALQPVATPYGGLLWGRELAAGHGHVDLAATYRQEQRTDANLHTAFSASNEAFSLPAGIDAALVAFYDPAIAKAASGFQYGKAGLYLAYEKAYWSRYRSAQLRLGGDDIVMLQGGESDDGTVKLKDTDSYQLGLELKESYSMGQAALRFGYEQHGSALPRGISRPVVVDLARDVYALGVGYLMSGVQKMNALSFDLAYQWTSLRERSFVDSKGVAYRAGGQVSTLIGGCRLEI